MKLKVCLTAAALCAFALTAVAQHDHAAPKSASAAPAMDPAMMDAMMKAGTPGEPHKKLDGMAGTWDTKITMWMMPGTEPMISAGTSTSQWVMGGRYLEERFKGDFGGMPFEGLGFTGYDNVKKRYWGTWMDNMSTSMMSSSGTAAADGKSWDFDGTMSDPMTGGETALKTKVTVRDADHHVMEMWAPGPDGKMFKSMEIAYSRKK
jgi:hypothetical protein